VTEQIRRGYVKMTKQEWQVEHRRQRIANHLRIIHAEEQKPKDQISHACGLHWYMLYKRLEHQGLLKEMGIC